MFKYYKFKEMAYMNIERKKLYIEYMPNQRKFYLILQQYLVKLE